MHKTDAWVLYQGSGESPGPTQLKREEFQFPDITSEEVLVRPLYGCWEGNMGHALERQPVDICRMRREERVVIGNAGVVEVVQCGADVTTVSEGDRAIVFCNGVWDAYGYPKRIFGYDAPGTIGVLARKTKLHQMQLIPVPKGGRFDMARWAAFSLRFVTAWSNWRLAFGTFRLQLEEHELHDPIVWGWGGGVALATLQLARLAGCDTLQISSREDRRDAARQHGIDTVDRSEFPHLSYDDARYKSDDDYRARYRDSEERFLDIVSRQTGGRGVNIFIDYVGSPVLRATLKALARQGIVTTAGWKEGMVVWFLRASECIDRHQHIHTHYARYTEGLQAVRFAEANAWLPTPDARIYEFDEVPELAADYAAGRFTYYPCFRVNPE